jgi:hypothetical protein
MPLCARINSRLTGAMQAYFSSRLRSSIAESPASQNGLNEKGTEIKDVIIYTMCAGDGGFAEFPPMRRGLK